MEEQAFLASQLSGGLIEISAVATLIGAPVAESMTLGLKSAAGLPWASVTLFGMVHVAKASLAAAIPDWLREPLGLHNANVDAALGLMHELRARQSNDSRTDLGDPAGTMISRKMPSQKRQATKRLNIYRKDTETAIEVYQLDRMFRLFIDTTPEPDPGKHILLYEFMPDDGKPTLWLKDVIILVASLCKLAEPLVLRRLGANELWIITGIGWLWSMLFAVVLTSVNASRDRVDGANSDLLTGRLPSHLTAGGSGRLLMGAPLNVRRSRLWRLYWLTNSLAALVTLIGTYVVLGKNPAKVVYCWVGFQAFWLCVRTVVFYILDSAAGSSQSLSTGRSWRDSHTDVQTRTLQLLMALARHTAVHHARGFRHYKDDLEIGNLEELLSQCKCIAWKLSECTGQVKISGTLQICGVVGDNFLRAISWLYGATRDNNDLYDSSLIFISIDGRRLAVPVVRVITCRCPRSFAKQHAPRGDSHGNVCKTMVWAIFIPAICGSGRTEHWIYASGVKTKGTLAYELLSKDELDTKLSDAYWQISLKTSTEFEKVLGVSRATSDLLLKMTATLSRSESSGKHKESVIIQAEL